MLYWTTLNLAKLLTEKVRDVQEQEVDVETIGVVEAWKHSIFLCRNYVLNGLHDSMFDVYTKLKIVKELWESLNHMYKSEDDKAVKLCIAIYEEYFNI